ncbi:hypothetical protein T12_16777 [Trichinella patagoniensis]|uniref:Uncharacterized protein n=1 Tax=Trichinella patagoniensis TaxID=990121 RepID=A0A0V0ZSX8_9BILA|nr:hypothetical protein T12_16777 [Trichinella patagoniensis]
MKETDDEKENFTYYYFLSNCQLTSVENKYRRKNAKHMKNNKKGKNMDHCGVDSLFYAKECMHSSMDEILHQGRERE